MAAIVLFCLALLVCIVLGTNILYALLAGLVIFALYGKKQGFSWKELGKMICSGVKTSASVLLVFPLIVSMGAGSRVTDARSVAVCKFLGEISYPLYVTHYPLVYMQMAWAASNPEAPLGTHIFVSVSVFIMSVGLAWACLKLYDLPVREWLTRPRLRGGVRDDGPL